MYVKTRLNFKGRNHPLIWGSVEGKASHSMEKVNKGDCYQIPLYFSLASGICRVTAFFMGLADCNSGIQMGGGKGEAPMAQQPY